MYTTYNATIKRLKCDFKPCKQKNTLSDFNFIHNYNDKIIENYDITNVITYLNNNNNTNAKHIISIYKKNKDKNMTNNEIKFIIPNGYPFIRPEVYINDKYYLDFFRPNLIRKKKYIKMLTKQNDCLCCESILCPDVWTPPMTISMILNEFEAKIKINTDAIKLFYADKITKKYFFTYFVDFKIYLINQ